MARRSAAAATKPDADTKSKRGTAGAKGAAGSTPAPRARHDWEAVERDFRTGKFTLKELEAKHGPGFADISRRAKKYGWTKDLQAVVRQATAAAVIAETTKLAANLTNEAQTQTTNVVLAAAELNKQVILKHRSDIAEARELSLALLNEIRTATLTPEKLRDLFETLTADMDPLLRKAVAQQFGDMMRIHARVGSMHKLADTLSKLQAAERKAFGLDEEEGDKGDVGDALAQLVHGIHSEGGSRLPIARPAT